MSLEDLLENPEWRRNWTYATTQMPNGGFYRRWPQGGNPGMNSPMNIWATEYSTLMLKHGTNNPSPYRGSLQPFSPLVTSQMNRRVENCIDSTWNGGICIGKAIYEVTSQEDARARVYQTQRVQLPPSGPQD
jgi:hypothetical protein